MKNGFYIVDYIRDSTPHLEFADYVEVVDGQIYLYDVHYRRRQGKVCSVKDAEGWGAEFSEIGF